MPHSCSSRLTPYYPCRAQLAQSVEHGTFNPRVVGSSPTLGEATLLYPNLRATRVLLKVTMKNRKGKKGAHLPAVTRIRTWVIAATTQGTNHYTITATRSHALAPLSDTSPCAASTRPTDSHPPSEPERGGGRRLHHDPDAQHARWTRAHRLAPFGACATDCTDESAPSATAAVTCCPFAGSAHTPSPAVLMVLCAPPPSPWHGHLTQRQPAGAVVAEWLRRLTRNQFPSGSVGSSPTDCGTLLRFALLRVTVCAPTRSSQFPTIRLPLWRGV